MYSFGPVTFVQWSPFWEYLATVHKQGDDVHPPLKAICATPILRLVLKISFFLYHPVFLNGLDLSYFEF